MPCSDVQAYPAQPIGQRALYGYGQAPIAYGLFPHYINHFVNETRALSLEEAVRKATSVPAQRVFHLTDRGLIRPGAYADVLVFDPQTIREGGDFMHPAGPPRGIEWVLVNGTVTYRHGAHTGARAGRVLRRGQP
jgi:N-acyl-D-amino-acid deacylase